VGKHAHNSRYIYFHVINIRYLCFLVNLVEPIVAEHSAGQREGEPREQSPGAREVKVAIAPSLFDGDAVGRGYEGPDEDADPEEHRRAGEHGEDGA
jgi:hypothetical protein